MGGTADLRGISGVLLAGGRSVRMGRDKRFLQLDGVSLLDRALSVFDRLFPEVLIVVAEMTPDLDALGRRVVTDLIPNRAALGGLYTGLFHASQARVFVAACDMPFLNPAVVTALTNAAPRADVVMARLAHGLQPMHAVYSKRCLPTLEVMAEENDLKVQSIADAPDLVVHIVSEEDLRRMEPQLLSFMNINTPADLEFARKLLAGRGVSGGTRS